MGNEKIIKYRRDLHLLFPGPGKAAEIGVAEGNFSNDMLLWKTGGRNAVTRLWMVDRWKSVPTQLGDAANPQQWHDDNLFRVMERTEQFGRRASILRGDSVLMAAKVQDGSLVLLYIDGDHSKNGVMADLMAWCPKVMEGGFVALHDYLNPSYWVKEAVREYVEGSWEVHVIPEDKPEDAGAWFQIT